MARAPLLATLTLCGSLLQADGLADLKAALKALPMAPNIRAIIEEESREREDGKDRIEHRTVQVEDGPEGTTIRLEGRPVTPAKPSTPGAPGVKKGTRAFQGTLRPALELLEKLDKARLLEEKPDTWEGQPVRRLKLAMDLKLDEEGKGSVKKASHEAMVWIGTDGVPLAMDQQIEVKVRVLLVASVWTKVKIHIQFQRIHGRLLVREERSDMQGSALGKAFGSQELTRCSVLP